MLLILFTICSLCILTYCNLSYYCFGFDGRTLVLIISVRGHCLSFTSDMLKGISLKTTNYFFYKFNYILKTIQLHKSAASYKTQFLHM